MARPTKSIFGRMPEKVCVNYVPHSGQDEVTELLTKNFESSKPASIVEIVASRGWGKTLYTMCSIVIPYLNAADNAKVMWVAPTYGIGMAPIEDVLRGVDETTGERWVPDTDSNGNKIWEFSVGASGPVLKWWSASTVTFKSADSPESIVSRGYNLIIIDEAALIEERVFLQQIMGTARKEGIKIFMITSPRGKRHWTYKMFMKGQDKKEVNYISVAQPYTKNPHFNKTLANLIKDLPEWLYRQEYMAEFIDDGDSVIRGLDHILEGPEVSFDSNQQEWEVPITDITVMDINGERKVAAADRRFICGMDLAKSVDYTVMWVMDMDSGQCVYYRRMNKTDYRAVLDHASKICKRFNHCELIFDSTGVGGGLADFLNNYDITAHPYTFTNESKNDLINRLILAVEYQEIKVPNIVTVKNEMNALTYSLTRTGKISYAAPAGFHDDVVMAIALANWYRKENSVTSGDTAVVEAVINANTSGASGRETFWDFMLNDND